MMRQLFVGNKMDNVKNRHIDGSFHQYDGITISALNGTVYFSGSQTLCTDTSSSDRTVVVNPYSLNVCIPFSSGMSH